MAEIIGIASGIAGLISLTIEVFGVSYKYVGGVRRASTAVRQFLAELDELKAILMKIERMAIDEDEDNILGQGKSSILSVKETYDYLHLLDSVRQRLEDRNAHESWRKRIKDLTWPFSEKETLKLVEQLHRHLERYKTAMAMDNLYNVIPGAVSHPMANTDPAPLPKSSWRKRSNQGLSGKVRAVGVIARSLVTYWCYRCTNQSRIRVALNDEHATEAARYPFQKTWQLGLLGSGNTAVQELGKQRKLRSNVVVPGAS